jgi:hypothetical protein
MNTQTPRHPSLKTSPVITQAQTLSPRRREYRERDFGIGYGRSSGYASQRQYASGWNGQALFRCS